MRALRALLSLSFVSSLACGDNSLKQGRMCGLADCGDQIRATTTARCLLESYLECVPTSAALVVGGVTHTYSIDAYCRVQYSDGAALRSCASLSFSPLHSDRACPWLTLSDCGPTLLLPR